MILCDLQVFECTLWSCLMHVTVLTLYKTHCRFDKCKLNAMPSMLVYFYKPKIFCFLSMIPFYNSPQSCHYITHRFYCTFINRRYRFPRSCFVLSNTGIKKLTTMLCCVVQVFSKDGSTEVGKISKQWSGMVREYFTDADNFGVSCKSSWLSNLRVWYWETHFHCMKYEEGICHRCWQLWRFMQVGWLTKWTVWFVKRFFS